MQFHWPETAGWGGPDGRRLGGEMRAREGGESAAEQQRTLFSAIFARGRSPVSRTEAADLAWRARKAAVVGWAWLLLL